MQTLRDFRTEVLSATTTVLVDVTASWCPPCRALMPILRALSAERNVPVYTVDGEADLELARRLDVRAFPTVIAFSGGREVGRLVGLHSKEKLARLLG